MDIQTRHGILSNAHSPLVMGIVNATPDSFFDGNKNATIGDTIEKAISFIDAGAHILDIGGESTRPNSKSVSLEVELARVIPVIKELRNSGVSIPISIDTRSARVAVAALKAGADIVNDVSALRDDAEMKNVIASEKIPCVLMHRQGVSSKTMQDKPVYSDVVSEVYEFLKSRVEIAFDAGIDNVIVDVGIGFGKTHKHNLELLHNLKTFSALGAGQLLGASRKQVIGDLTGADVSSRLPGSIAIALYAKTQGVEIIRVHDVLETIQALKMWQAMEAGDIR